METKKKTLTTLAMLGQEFRIKETKMLNKIEKFKLYSGLNQNQITELMNHIRGYGYKWGIFEFNNNPEDNAAYFVCESTGSNITDTVIKLANEQAEKIIKKYGILATVFQIKECLFILLKKE